MDLTVVCKTPAECKGWLGIVVDVIVGIKMVILVALNMQGYFWWRNTRGSNFTFSIKFLFIISTAIVRFLSVIVSDNSGVCV